MSSLILYHAPGACSQVTMTALEECGLDYTDVAVDLWRGTHRTPEYLALNPKGSVPALAVDGEVLTENAAILLYLHLREPEAGLLPHSDDLLTRARQISDLVLCSSTWHPLVRAIRMPGRLTRGDPDPVRERGIEVMTGLVGALDVRVRSGRWWYGAQWSIVDVYLHWSYTMAAKGGFDLTPYPAVRDHAERVRQHPSFVRAFAREAMAIENFDIAEEPAVRK
jgi:glutathione S-transferase